MKIAYLLSWELGSLDGVTKKVYAQTQVWAAMGHEVAIFCITKEGTAPNSPVPAHLFKREKGDNIFTEYSSIQNAYKRAHKALSAYNPDIIYHRSEIYQPELGKVLAKFPAVVEINTNDLTELKLLAGKNLKGKVRYHYYKLIRDTYLQKAAGFCCVTHEIAALESFRKYKKPMAVIPNTIETDLFNLPLVAADNILPRLVFMGSPNQSWHGIDKILALAQATTGLLEFDIIGPTQPASFNSPNVRFHGFLKQTAYEKVLEKCDIGICTMALHRNYMDEACPLKTREYLAYGLPVILGYKDTAFADTLPPWILQLENTEDNIANNINTIVDFAKRLKGTRLAKDQVKKYIDSKVYEHKRVSFMEHVFEKATLVTE